MDQSLINSRLQEVFIYLKTKRIVTSEGELATILGVSKNTIINYKKGSSPIPAHIIQYFGINYGVSMEWLIKGTGNMIIGEETTPPSCQHNKRSQQPILRTPTGQANTSITRGQLSEL